MADQQKIVLELEAKTKKLVAELKKAKKSIKGVDDQTNRMRISTAGLRRSIGALRNNMLLVSFAFGGTAKAVSSLIRAYGEQELAERKLEQALGFTSQALLTQASALQQQTSFGDEAIIGVQALIGAFTKDEEQIKELTKTTLDLAAAKGMDLTAAADLVSKSFGSSTNALSRYGIQVEGAVGSTERLENLTGNVAALFGGQASAQADTMTGAMQQMSNALGDTSETMGALLEPSTIAFSKAIKKAAEGWSEFFLELKETEMETAVRQLREMGAAAEDLALLEQFVLIERHSEAIINNNKKIIEAVHDQNTLYGNRASLSDDELIFLGATIIQREREKNILSSGQIVRERQVVLTEQERVNQENVLHLINKIKKENKDIIKDKESLSDQDKIDIKANALKIEDLTHILMLIRQQESARKALSEVGNEDTGGGGGGTAPPEEDTEAWDKFLEKQKAIVDTQEEFTLMMAEKHIAYALEQELLAEWIKNNKELAESMGIVTDSQKKQKETSEALTKSRKQEGMQFLKNIQAATDGNKKYEGVFKAAAITEATINTAQAMIAAYKSMAGIPIVGQALGVAAATAAGLAGATQIQKIQAAQYGMNEVVDEPTLILAGENNQAESVQITPLEGPNIEGVQGEGASVVVNVSGNILTSDFVEGELADNIREAVRRGTDFGIG